MTARPTLAAPDACAVVARSLAQAGIRRVYTVPGDLTYALLRAMDQAGLSICSCRSQATAVFASAADSFALGAPASVVVVSRGPAVMNALPAMAAVQAHGTPVLLLAPAEPASESARGAFQGGAVDPATVPGATCVRITAPDQLAPGLQTALGAIRPPAFGAAVVEIDRGVLDTDIPGPAPVQPPGPPDEDTAWLPRAVELLTAAHRPAVVVGHMARWTVPLPLLAQLSARLNAPLCPTGLTGGFGGTGLDVVPQDRVHRTLAGADAVLLIGAQLDWALRFGAAIPPTARIVQLCHRPGPPRARQPDLSVPGDIGGALSRLLHRLPDRKAPASLPDAPAPLAVPRRRPPATLTEHVLRMLAAAFPPQAAFVVDGSSALVFASRVVQPAQGWARITPGLEGHLGAGLGHAIGAVRAGRFAQAVLLTGDFSLGLALSDLETLLRYDLPVKVLVANNFGLASEADQMAGADPRAVRYNAATDHAAIMRGFGGTASRIRSPDDWQAAAEVLARPGPGLIDIIDPRSPD